MPCLAPDTVAGILQWVMLQSIVGDPHAASPREQPLTVARHEMREPLAEPEMSMEPKATTHGVDHPFATIAELEPIALQCLDILRRSDRRERRTVRPLY